MRVVWRSGETRRLLGRPKVITRVESQIAGSGNVLRSSREIVYKDHFFRVSLYSIPILLIKVIFLFRDEFHYRVCKTRSSDRSPRSTQRYIDP